MTRFNVKRVVFYEPEPTPRERFCNQFHYRFGPVLYMILGPNVCIVMLGYVFLTGIHRLDNELAFINNSRLLYDDVFVNNNISYQENTSNDTFEDLQYLESSADQDYVRTFCQQGSDKNTSAIFSKTGNSRKKTINFLRLFRSSWLEAGVGNWEVWVFVCVFGLWALLSQVMLGGKKYEGPPTMGGHIPEYENSSFRYYVINALIMGILIGFETFEARAFYRRLPALAGALNIFGFVLSLLLYVKGMYHPSKGDSGTTGSLIFDFYRGVELYPRIMYDKVDVKILINSRFGMMLWQLIVWICWKSQVESCSCNWAMSVLTLMQTVYIAKFFWTEDGYTKGIDMHVDYAGFYTTWTHVCFIPTFYSLAVIDMTFNTPEIGWFLALVLFNAGFLVMVGTFWVDFQRRKVRETNGNCEVCCRTPKFIVVSIFTQHGASALLRDSIILASGWWGIGRHVNYFFELLTAFMWAMPSCFASWVPFLYCGYITVFLFHRSFRDEKRCKKKYGAKWDEYCEIARWRMIPGIF